MIKMSNDNISNLLKDSLPNVIEFWFNQDSFYNNWFQSDYQKKKILDTYINKTFKNSLDLIEILDVEKIKENFNINQLVATIVCLDQFTRHIYRNNNIKSIEKIYNNTEKAILIADHIINNKLNQISDYNQIIFILMPYKHKDITNNFIVIRNVLKKFINVYDISLPDINKTYLYKFYQDSLKKYLLKNNKVSLFNHNQTYQENLFNKYDYSKVCAFMPLLDPNTNEIDDKNKLVKTCKIFLDHLDKNLNIVVSLSGGVDSMVLLYILAYLCRKSNRDIKAFHINYNNRELSLVEEDMIKTYCKNIEIDLYIHRITFIKRKNCKRDFYENVTKQVRFNLYRMLGGNIVLGHIIDDLIENIWTNFSKGRDLFKLHKIDMISKIDGVNIYRPFFETHKKDIKMFSFDHNIPYLNDTTPTWSNRGKLRNEFLPAVEQQFGTNTNEKIIYMSKSLESYYNILEKKVFNPLYENIKYEKNKAYINIHEYIGMNVHFWHEVLKKIFHQFNLNMPSIKSVQNFVHFINNKKYGKISLHKYLQVFYQNYVLTFIPLNI